MARKFQALMLSACALALAGCSSTQSVMGARMVFIPEVKELGIKQEIYEAIYWNWVGPIPANLTPEQLRKNSKRWADMSIDEMLADMGVDDATRYISPEEWRNAPRAAVGEKSGDTLNWRRSSPNVAYIKIDRFSSTTASDMQGIVGQMMAAPPKVILMDLRGNGGGSFDAVIGVLSAFINGGELVTLVRQTGPTVYTATEDFQLDNVPIYVLVDGETAIGAEIVAMVLQSRGRAKIVGEPTAGRGNIRTVVPISHRGKTSGMWVTTAYFEGPNGERIESSGVPLDRAVEANEDPLTVAVQLAAETVSLADDGASGFASSIAPPSGPATASSFESDDEIDDAIARAIAPYIGEDAAPIDFQAPKDGDEPLPLPSPDLSTLRQSSPPQAPAAKPAKTADDDPLAKAIAPYIGDGKPVEFKLPGEGEETKPKSDDDKEGKERSEDRP